MIRTTLNVKYFAIKRTFHLFRIFYYSKKKNKEEQLFNYLHYNSIQKKKKCKKYIIFIKFNRLELNQQSFFIYI